MNNQRPGTQNKTRIPGVKNKRRETGISGKSRGRHRQAGKRRLIEQAFVERTFALLTHPLA
jgi:hypothetical protein